jgi:hypothetical protein
VQHGVPGGGAPGGAAAEEASALSLLQLAHFAALHLLYVIAGTHCALVRQPLYQRLRRDADARAAAAAAAAAATRAAAARRGGPAAATLCVPLLAGGEASASAAGEAGAGEEEARRPQQVAVSAPPSPAAPPLGGSPRAAWSLLTSGAPPGDGRGTSPCPPVPPSAGPGVAPGPPPAGWGAQAGLLLQVLLPVAAAAGEYCTAALFATPAAAGMAMAGLSMLQVGG